MMQKPDNDIINYKVYLAYDGITRIYYCENHFDTVILFDALFRHAQYDYIEVYGFREDKVIQSVKK